VEVPTIANPGEDRVIGNHVPHDDFVRTQPVNGDCDRSGIAASAIGDVQGKSDLIARIGRRPWMRFCLPLALLLRRRPGQLHARCFEFAEVAGPEDEMYEALA